MNNITLFLLAAFIWGSTWLMITFQLGSVEPLVSVIYRFTLASLILFSYCLVTRKRLSYSKWEHLLILIQGLFLFGFNYWLTYLGITKVNSSMAAILSTSIVYFNVIFAKVFLSDKIKKEVVIGATIGVVGISLVFSPDELLTEPFWNSILNSGGMDSTEAISSETWTGIQLVLVASIFASLGNILSAKTQRKKIPVIQANALGMAYAVILLSFVAIFSGAEFTFEMSIKYVGSLFYLAIFGTVIAFGAFLTLVGRIGPDKAGYISLVYPVIALVFSTIFEDYQWSLTAGMGVIVILFGNFIAMGKHKTIGKLFHR